VYSHNGNGLKNKADTLDEYVSIREAWDPASTATPGESPHGVLLSRVLASAGPQDRYVDWHSFGDHSVVWLTHPVCFRYEVEAMLNAQLEPQSLGHLLELYWESVRGMLWAAHDEVDKSLWREGEGGIAGEKRKWEEEKAEKDREMREWEEEKAKKDREMRERLSKLQSLANGTGLGKSPALAAIERAAREEQARAQAQAPGLGDRRKRGFSAVAEKQRQTARKSRKTTHSSEGE